MNRCSDLVDRHSARGDEHDRGNHGNPGSVNPQAGNAAKRHTDVGERKNEGDKGRHWPS
jgi:hypothetical protein